MVAPDTHRPDSQRPDTHQYTYEKFPFRTPPELGGAVVLDKPPDVLIVGAGPVGLAAALDLADRGIPCLIVDRKDQVSDGSRAICWAKRSLEICNRLGVADPMMAKGIVWSKGRVFLGRDELYNFDLQPESGYQFPAFINLQQYYVEDCLIARAMAHPLIDLRFGSAAAALTIADAQARVDIATPEGDYAVKARWLLACDGARSPVRKMMGLDFVGRVFEDRFLIADVKMISDFPTERWFWYHPWFHEGPSALLHRQADNVFRLDFQLGPDVDPDVETAPERVRARCRKVLGDGVDFDFDWISLYRFQGRRLPAFRHGPVIFAGDSAHQVSPFGARGGNSGLQDVDNLGWKLAMVLAGHAPEDLIDSYGMEREAAADENLRVTGRTTDFMSAKSPQAVAFRDAALGLARSFPFARALVNAGRLSVANHYPDSPLNTPDEDIWDGGIAPGSPLLDAPINRNDWLLDRLPSEFLCLIVGDPQAVGFTDADGQALAKLPVPVTVVHVADPSRPTDHLAGVVQQIMDRDGLVAARLDATAGAVLLIRPDHHVAGRWRRFDTDTFSAALARACGRKQS